MSNIKTCLRKDKKSFQQFLHNKQLKFGLLVPVGLLMHEQSTKIIPSHKFHHRKSAAQKNENINFYQIYSVDNGPTGI